MNEALIRNVIKYKLNAAEKILEKLPTEVSNNLKSLGKTILESVNECSEKANNQPVSKSKSTGKLNNIKIE